MLEESGMDFVAIVTLYMGLILIVAVGTGAQSCSEQKIELACIEKTGTKNCLAPQASPVLEKSGDKK